jgi:glycosyltransferase involved in cell wall biosynthesis
VILNRRVAVVLPAYNAAKTLERTYAEIPKDVVDDVILTDDASADATAELARSLGLYTIKHEHNRGYGGNQKTCYAAALERGADIVVMLHPDYQYTPRLVTAMASMIASEQFDAVLASRILGGGALAGGMPLYKYVANRMLTAVQNILFSEFHTGYRAWSRDVLLRLPLLACSDDFVFDNQMITQALFFGFRVGAIGVFGLFVVALLLRRRMDLIWLFAAGCCVMVLTYYGSLGTLVDRISVDGGGRYYYVPQAVFGLVVLGLAATCHDIVAKLSWVVVVWLVVVGVGGVSSPGARRARPRLEVVDRRALLQRQADVVEPFHQAALAEGIDVKMDDAAVGPSDLLSGKVDGDGGVRPARSIVDELVDFGLRQGDRQDAVLEAVVVEDVGEGRRDDAPDAEIEQRPRGVLARGAAAEILSHDQDLRLRVGRLVQHEIGARLARLVIAELGEEPVAQPGALDGLEVLLGDDHVGVDIDHRQVRGNGGERGEFLHGKSSCRCTLCSLPGASFPVAWPPP